MRKFDILFFFFFIGVLITLDVDDQLITERINSGIIILVKHHLVLIMMIKKTKSLLRTVCLEKEKETSRDKTKYLVLIMMIKKPQVFCKQYALERKKKSSHDKTKIHCLPHTKYFFW